MNSTYDGRFFGTARIRIDRERRRDSSWRGIIASILGAAFLTTLFGFPWQLLK